MDRLRSLGCRAIVAACFPIGKLAQRLLDWSASQQRTVQTVTPAPTWAEVAADARADRWPGPFDYSQSADHDTVVRCMHRDGIGSDVHINVSGAIEQADVDKLIVDLRKWDSGQR